MRFGRIAVSVWFVSSLVGCAGGEDTPAPWYPPETGKVDTGGGIELDTGSIELDTGSVEEDTGTEKKDTGVAVDSSVPSDTGSVPDSGADTTTESDTAVATDTLVVDSSVADTTIDDTTVADTTAADTALPDTFVPDTAVADTSTSDTADAGSGPTRVYTGTSLVLHGVTTDDYVIFSESTGATWAVPLAGGTAQAIGTGTTRVLVSGKVAFAWGTTDTYGFGALRVWSAATGAKAIATKSLAPGGSSATYYIASASQDGQYIFFTDGGVGGTSDKADFKVAKADGTGVKTVFTQYVVYDGTTGGYTDSCAPYAAWVGTRFVTTHCTPATTISLSASAIDPVAGTATSLGTNLSAYWTADDAGTKVAIVSSGTLRMIPPTGGTAITIDTGVGYGVFTHDGSAFVYRTTANALKRSPSTSASPTTLVASGATTLLSATSPDDKWILYASTGSSGAYDIRRASTTTASTTTLQATANADVYGAGFTADSAYAVYYTGVNTTIGIGTLVAYPMAGGAASTLGTNAWYDVSTTGSKLVFNDDHVGTASAGTATLRSRDIASGTSTTIVASADRNFSMSAARDRVVYLVSTGTSAGLWVAAVP